jgi:hypothetical protein
VIVLSEECCGERVSHRSDRVVEVQRCAAGIGRRDLRLAGVEPEDLDPILVVSLMEVFPIKLPRVLLSGVVDVALRWTAHVAAVVVLSMSKSAAFVTRTQQPSDSRHVISAHSSALHSTVLPGRGQN